MTRVPYERCRATVVARAAVTVTPPVLPFQASIDPREGHMRTSFTVGKTVLRGLLNFTDSNVSFHPFIRKADAALSICQPYIEATLDR